MEEIEKFTVINLDSLDDFIKNIRCPNCSYEFKCVGERVICPKCKMIIDLNRDLK
ncbi:hypothetical protein ACO3TA_02605 [Methanocaldococcus sp. 28A]